jgi:hypothetical protein
MKLSQLELELQRARQQQVGTWTSESVLLAKLKNPVSTVGVSAARADD